MAQLFYASRLELWRFKLICESVRDSIIKDNKNFDDCLFDKLDLDDEVFDIDDARACFAAVNYIIENALLYKVSPSLLSIELEQLGLASEHCQLLCNHCLSFE